MFRMTTFFLSLPPHLRPFRFWFAGFVTLTNDLHLFRRWLSCEPFLCSLCVIRQIQMVFALIWRFWFLSNCKISRISIYRENNIKKALQRHSQRCVRVSLCYCYISSYYDSMCVCVRERVKWRNCVYHLELHISKHKPVSAYARNEAPFFTAWETQNDMFAFSNAILFVVAYRVFVVFGFSCELCKTNWLRNGG